MRRCPSALPDCHLVRTAIPFLPDEDSLGDFHHSLSASLASFADRVSESKGLLRLRPEPVQPDLSSAIPTQGRLRLHTALRPYEYRCTALQVHYLFRTQLEEYHDGSTAMHKNRSPQKQGRGNHAIGNRPESASTRGALPPSTHPKLGVSSRHQRFHRCAL